MSAEEALKYGLIDEIVPPNDDKIKNLMTLPPAHSKMFGQTAEGEEDYEFGKIVSFALLDEPYCGVYVVNSVKLLKLCFMKRRVRCRIPPLLRCLPQLILYGRSVFDFVIYTSHSTLHCYFLQNVPKPRPTPGFGGPGRVGGYV